MIWDVVGLAVYRKGPPQGNAQEGRNAMDRLRRPTGQMGLPSTNLRKLMTACVQSVALYRPELRWTGEGNRGGMGGTEELQKLTNQLENRQRRFGLRLPSLPQGGQAPEVVGATSAIGTRMQATLERYGRTEKAAPMEDRVELNVITVMEGETAAGREADRSGAGRVPRAEQRATRWRGRRGNRGVGPKARLGCNQNPSDAECAAMASALEATARRRRIPERAAIFKQPDVRDYGRGRAWPWTRCTRSRPEIG